MLEEWVVSIRDLCAEARVPFFFKQWGGVRKKRNGRSLQGRTYDEYPTRVRMQIPERSRCLKLAESIRSSALRFSDRLIELTA